MSKSLENAVNWILTKQDKDEPDITNLKLQKLLFYIDGCFGAVHKKSLFAERFQAWKHGPVVKSVYDKYKKFKDQPIIVSTDDDISESSSFSKEELDTLNEAYSLFGHLSPWTLRNISHEEQPWIDAFNKGEGSFIDKQETINWFSKKYLKDA